MYDWYFDFIIDCSASFGWRCDFRCATFADGLPDWAKEPKKARKIHAQQTLRDRITLRYIKTMLKKNRSAFEKFYLLYMVLLVTLLPQYAAAIASCVVLGDSARYVLYGFLIVKAFLAVFYRLQFDSLHISIYAKK